MNSWIIVGVKEHDCERMNWACMANKLPHVTTLDFKKFTFKWFQLIKK